jgi:hypothetical protein
MGETVGYLKEGLIKEGTELAFWIRSFLLQYLQ